MAASAKGFVGAFVVALAAAGCGNGDSGGSGGGAPADARGDASGANFQPAGADGQVDMEKAAADAAKAFKEMNAGKEIKAVDPAAIKALLPAEIAGAKRKNVETQQINQMGMDIATTQCDFEPVAGENDDGSHPKPNFHLTITDVGNMTGAYSMAFASWANISINKETETGYEKTGKYRSLPCHEEYDRDSKSGSLKVLVAKRFIVDMSGNDCTMDQIKAAVDALDTSKLEALVR